MNMPITDLDLTKEWKTVIFYFLVAIFGHRTLKKQIKVCTELLKVTVKPPIL